MLHRSALIALALGTTTLGCTQIVYRSAPPVHVEEARRGPPPHAPAHGYRHKHVSHGSSVDLVFDSGLGVYVVVGWPDHYWRDDHYYRWVDGTWMVSVKLDGGWISCGSSRLPPGLVAKHGVHGKKKWKHPAKHGY